MIQITMPRLSDTMAEGAISTWYKKPGDRVEAGEPLVEIETDKATMDFEAYDSGVLTKILVPEGQLVAIGRPIAELDDGGSAPEPGAAEAAPKIEAKSESKSESSLATVAAAVGRQDAIANDRRLVATPLVRALARENGIDLRDVRGSGPGGRIVKRDIESRLTSTAPAVGDDPASMTAAMGPAPTPAPPFSEAVSHASSDLRRGSEEVPLSTARRVIARRLAESARSTPQFYVTADADAEALVDLRTALNGELTAAGRPKISINDLLVRASAIALRQHPLVNASYQGGDTDKILVHHRINIGIAVASDNGLVVPVIDDADQKTVTQLAAEARRLIALANDRKLTPAQMSAGTFTVSNLGMFGVEQFTAIINPPEGAILAVGATRREPAVIGDEVLPRYRIRYTMSADHRIIDGALAAQFLQTITQLIEHPWTIIA